MSSQGADSASLKALKDAIRKPRPAHGLDSVFFREVRSYQQLKIAEYRFAITYSWCYYVSAVTQLLTAQRRDEDAAQMARSRLHLANGPRALDMMLKQTNMEELQDSICMLVLQRWGVEAETKEVESRVAKELEARQNDEEPH